MEQKDSLLGVLQTLFKWKRPILIATLVAAVGSAIIVLVIPVYYQATTIFYAASPDLASPEAIFGEASEAMEYYGEDEDVDRVLTIAESSELAEYLIQRFNLYEHYEIDTTDWKAPYKVQEKLSKLYEVKKTKYDAVQLSVEDQDKVLAAEMANAARERIDSVGQKLVKESQAKLLRTYEANIASKEDQLRVLIDSLQRVRKQYGVYNTESQSEVLATLLAEAESQLTNTRARLNVLKEVAGIPRDTITYLRAAIDGAQQEVAQLERKLDLFNDGMALVDMLVEIQIETSDQLSEDQVRYKQLQSAYESNFSAIHLVEAATVPIIKSRPKRSMLVLAATFIAFIFCIMGVLLIDAYRDVNWREIIHARKD